MPALTEVAWVWFTRRSRWGSGIGDRGSVSGPIQRLRSSRSPIP